MNNYEAIMKMSKEQLADFLDSVYITGLNNGIFSANTDNETLNNEILDSNPFDLNWLNDIAEQGVLNQDDIPQDDKILLDALVQSIFRCADIDENLLNNNDTTD